MADETKRKDAGEHAPASSAPAYELRYFARKHGLTTAQATDLLRRFGQDRGKLNEAAVKLRRGLPDESGKRP